jgi:hypothetical protein
MARVPQNFLRSSIQRYAYHCSWAPLMPSDSDFGQNWKPGTGESRLFSNDPKGFLGVRVTGDPHTTRPLINQSSCTGEHVEIK